MNWLLVAGLLRVSVFAFGAWYGWRTKHWVMVSACGITTLSSTVFALYNAAVIGQSGLVTFAAYMSTPVAVGLVAAMMFNNIEPFHKHVRWRP